VDDKNQVKKQNRFLFIVLAFVIVILALILWKAGVFSETTNPPAIDVTDESQKGPEPDQESMSVPLKENSAEDLAKQDEQKNFQLILNDIASCFDLKSTTSADAAPVAIESIINFVQTDLGPATNQSDRWMTWNIRNQDQGERRLRLEITEDDDGKRVRELKYYAIDKDGAPIPMELPPEKSENPSDETVNQMLKEGEVFYKEKAAYVDFSGGEHIEYIEKNGTLSEIEFQKGDRYFRCQAFKARESCQCVR
jgi:cytoskeletal protein RodZ